MNVLCVVLLCSNWTARKFVLGQKGFVDIMEMLRWNVKNILTESRLESAFPLYDIKEISVTSNYWPLNLDITRKFNFVQKGFVV